MDVATRSSWELLPLPSKREMLDLCLIYSEAEGERMRRGFIPRDMDDRWFIFFEDGWLYFHRSWTGACIFGVRLEGSPNGLRVVEAWASRDQDQYRSSGVESDKQSLMQLIAHRLLG